MRSRFLTLFAATRLIATCWEGWILRRPSECIEYNDRCPANEPMATEGRILFEPPRAGAPAPRLVHF